MDGFAGGAIDALLHLRRISASYTTVEMTRFVQIRSSTITSHNAIRNCINSKEMLLWLRDKISPHFDSLEFKVDDDWKQWRLAAYPFSAPIYVFVITIGLREIRIQDYSQALREIRIQDYSQARAQFPLADPALVEKIVQYIKFCASDWISESSAS